MKIIILIFLSLSTLFGASTLELLNQISNDNQQQSYRENSNEKEKSPKIQNIRKEKPVLLTKNVFKNFEEPSKNKALQSYNFEPLFKDSNVSNKTFQKHHELMVNGYTILHIKQDNKSLSFFMLIRNDNKICSKNIKAIFNDINIQKMNICGYKMEIERKSLKNYFITLYNNKNYYDITINSEEFFKKFNTETQKNSFKIFNYN